jgi:hypothetical protein
VLVACTSLAWLHMHVDVHLVSKLLHSRARRSYTMQAYLSTSTKHGPIRTRSAKHS